MRCLQTSTKEVAFDALGPTRFTFAHRTRPPRLSRAGPKSSSSKSSMERGKSSVPDATTLRSFIHVGTRRVAKQEEQSRKKSQHKSTLCVQSFLFPDSFGGSSDCRRFESQVRQEHRVHLNLSEVLQASTQKSTQSCLIHVLVASPLSSLTYKAAIFSTLACKVAAKESTEFLWELRAQPRKPLQKPGRKTRSHLEPSNQKS